MPTFLPLDDFKDYMEITWSDDDAALSRLLDAAEGYLGDPKNGILGRPIAQTTFTEEFDSLSDVQIRFPDGAVIVSVTYTDMDDVTQTLGAIYRLKDDALVLNAGETWPQHKAPVFVTYTAGFDTVPQQIVNAGYYYAASIFEERDSSKSSADTMRKVLAQMVSGYRRIGL